MSTYGNKLDPYRSVRKAFGLKGIRQSIVVTNNPSTIDANQLLTVRTKMTYPLAVAATQHQNARTPDADNILHTFAEKFLQI